MAQNASKCHKSFNVLSFSLSLGEAILPIPRSSMELWRMIHFKYKKNRVIAHVVDGYDVTETRMKQPQVSCVFCE